MLSIRSSAAMARALNSPIDNDLKRLLAERREKLNEYGDYDLGDLAHFVAVEPGDTAAAVEAEMGFSPCTNLVDGSRYGQLDFTPSTEWIKDHGSWFEAVWVLSDDGFGIVLFVQQAPGVDSQLLGLCKDFAPSSVYRSGHTAALDTGHRNLA